MDESLKAELQKMLDEAVAKTGIGNGSEQVTPPKSGPEKKQPESGGADYGDMVGFSKSIEALQKAVETLTEALAKGKLPPWMKDDDADDEETKKVKKSADDESVTKAAEMAETVDVLKSVGEKMLERLEAVEKALTNRHGLSGQDGVVRQTEGFDGLVSKLARGGRVRMN